MDKALPVRKDIANLDSRMSPLKKIAIALIRGELTLSSEELATERLKVCTECPDFRHMTRQCSLCNCFMDMKTKILNTSCPKDLW